MRGEAAGTPPLSEGSTDYDPWASGAASGAPFQLFIESVKDYAIFMLDPEGRIATWNEGAKRLKGYSPDEVVGKHFSILYTEEDRRRHHPDEELDIARDHGRYEEEGWRRRKDGTRFWANVVITAVRDGTGRLIGFGKVTRDLTAEKRRQKRERELEGEQIARAEAEAANRAKSDFLAVMSHELRTPLNAMLGYVDLMLAGVPEAVPDESKVQLERVRASARHLLELIEQILTFSRIEAGREHVDVTRVDPGALADETAELLRPLAQEKGIPLEVDTSNAESLETDANKVRQILLNLLSNAIKYTEEGEVELRVRAEDGAMRLEVRDTGVGIAPEQIERIFEPFRQAGRGPTRVKGGTGLGLSVTRRLAELLGGTVAVDSTPGEGSTFTVRLPRQFSAPLPSETAAVNSME